MKHRYVRIVLGLSVEGMRNLTSKKNGQMREKEGKASRRQKNVSTEECEKNDHY